MLLFPPPRLTRAALFGALLMTAALISADEFHAEWPAEVSRPWAGADFWTNPLEDWRLRNGRIENGHSGGDRNVVLLTAELTEAEAGFASSVKVDQLSEQLSKQGFVGFELGLQGRFGDYRDSAVYGAGFAAGVAFDGRLFVGAPMADAPRLELPLRNVVLQLTGEPGGEGFQLALCALTPRGGS